MGDSIIKSLVSQQIKLIRKLIAETRSLIRPFESLDIVSEERMISFSGLLKMAASSFRELLETGLVDKREEEEIKQSLEDLKEQIEETEGTSIHAGLSG